MVIFCLKMPNFYKVKHVMEELLQIVKAVKDLIIEHKVANTCPCNPRFYDSGVALCTACDYSWFYCFFY